MKCPKCKNNTQVKDSRLITHINVVKRRRVCIACGYTTFTNELALDDMSNLVVNVGQAAKHKVSGTKLVTKNKTKTRPKPRKDEPDLDNMTDEELEAWIYNNNG